MRTAAMAVVVCVAAVVPLLFPPFTNFTLSLVMTYAVVGMGLNLLTGYSGQISIGHNVFVAVGAYTAAIMVERGHHYLLAIPVAVVISFVIGYLVGLPALRLQGLQLALVTLALAIILPSVIKRFDGITNGHAGITFALGDPPAWTGLAEDQWIYYLCLVIAVLAFVGLRRMTSGRMGRTLIAVRDYETVARSQGVRSSRIKTQAFAISGAYGGLAGVMYAYLVQYVSPDSFGLMMAISFITMIVVGGLGTTVGAVLGAFFIQYVPAWSSGIDQSAGGLSYGAALVIFMFVMPFGLVGLGRWVVRWAGGRFDKTNRPRGPRGRQARKGSIHDATLTGVSG